MNAFRWRVNATLGVWVTLGCAGSLAWGQPSDQPIDPLVNGEALVRLVPGADIAPFHATHGSMTLDAIAGRPIYLVQIPPETDPDAFKEAADADPDTVWVELNYYGKVPEARGHCFYGIPVEAEAFFGQTLWEQIGLEAALTQTIGGAMTIAIVDSGVDPTHPLLALTAIAPGWNFLDDSPDTSDVGNGLDDDGDDQIDEMAGHGTHVAGLATTTAPGATLMPIKVLGSDGHSSNWIVAEGIFFAVDQGVDVINISVGSTYDSDAVRDAVQEAVAAGIPVVAAGGNSDVSTPVEFPAFNAGVISVASVDEDDVKTYFSNYHEDFSVSAPGLQVISALPGGDYVPWDGTSMSAPLVSGVAALILSRHPDWPADTSRANNVRIALMQSADSVDEQNPDYAGLLGAGRLNAPAALAVQEAFAAGVTYPVGHGPEAVVGADFDGDEVRDLAVANTMAGTVTLLINQGDGTFAPAGTSSVGESPEALAAVDLDADGDQDLVVTCADAGTVAVLLNNGEGTFGTASQYAAGSDPHGVAIANLVGDTRPDVAVADDDSDCIVILRNTGGGALSVHTLLPVGARPRDIAAAHLNDDMHYDLVTVNRDADTISVVLSNGDGSFAAAQHFGVGANPRALLVADLDGDTTIDVVTANHDSKDMTLAWNNGAGSFATTSTVTLSNGRRPEQLAVADVDCDGDNDLIATSGDEAINTVAILLSRGDGTFLTPVDYGVDTDPRDVVATDLDADDDHDVVVANRGGNTVSVLLNLGCTSQLVGDVNCDGAVDFGDINPFVLLLSNPDAWQAQYPGCSPLTGDANGDGWADFRDINGFILLLGMAL